MIYAFVFKRFKNNDKNYKSEVTRTYDKHDFGVQNAKNKFFLIDSNSVSINGIGYIVEVFPREAHRDHIAFPLFSTYSML